MPISITKSLKVWSANWRVGLGIFPRPAFTLIELIISVALLIVAISISLFSTIGVGGLIQRSDARGVISEAGRSISDEIRRVVNNAPVGGVSLIIPNSVGGVPNGSFAGIQVKDYSMAQSNNTCSVIGRATVAIVRGEELYTINNSGSVVAVMIYKVDNAGLCPALSTTPIYQNRLTSNLSVVKTMNFYLQTVACNPPTPPACISKQLLRYALTVELAQKVNGRAVEANKPTLSIQDGLPIGLINEGGSAPTIVSGVLVNGTVGTSYLDSVVVSGGSPSYTWSLNTGSNPLPPGLTLEGTSGIISGTPTTAGTYTPTIKVVDSAGNIVTKQISITITSALTLSITTASLSPSSATEGNLYTAAAIQATGGTPSYNWSLIGNPGWLSINSSSAVISGTPPLGAAAASPYVLTVKVTDSASPTAGTATKVLSLTVSTAASLMITTATLPNATPGFIYFGSVAANNGTTPYSWQIIANDPALYWLTINASTGQLGGLVPFSVIPGTYNVTFRVTDALSATATKTLQITISGGGPPP